ncbi:MAG: hypothetical protein HZB41_01630 [Ignavibacteriae bacterium]|nr:hypothetical protein [Ignavibacteriota bacterium]
MKTKTFDCVELQRKIRDSFWNEANGDINKLNQIIDYELSKSDLYKSIKERKEKQMVSA